MLRTLTIRKEEKSTRICQENSTIFGLSKFVFFIYTARRKVTSIINKLLKVDSLVEKSIFMSKQIKPFMLSAFFLCTQRRSELVQVMQRIPASNLISSTEKTNKLSHEKTIHWMCGKNVHKHIRVDEGKEYQ